MSDLEESMTEGGEVALIFKYDDIQNKLAIRGYNFPQKINFLEKEKRNAYMAEAMKYSDIPDRNRMQIDNYFLGAYRKKPQKEENETEASVFTTKKYKPVALKVKPVYAELPDEYRIKRDIQGDPLKNMPPLNPVPPDFVPTGRYTQERKEGFDKIHQGEFLWPEERKLLHHLMMQQNQAFAWDDTERGRFREDFFPPIIIPTVEHRPWVYRNIPIPSGLYEEVCGIVK